MDMFGAITAENRLLEKSTKKLVDTTSVEAALREDLLADIVARLKAVESAREMVVYPEVRTIHDRPDIADGYADRVGAVRQSLDLLHRLPLEGREEFQNAAEILHQQVTDLVDWEIHEAFGVLRELIDPETATEMGDRIRAREEEVYHHERQI